MASSSARTSWVRPLRPSIALKHRHEANRIILLTEESELASQISYRGDHLADLRRAARSTNDVFRSHYKDFIHQVGRDVFPLIVFADSEADGPSGVGSTLTLYRSDGSRTTVSPALKSNYELYKVCGHLLTGLAVEVGPYLSNRSLCLGELCVGDDALAHENGEESNENGEELGLVPPFDSRKETEFAEDVPWRASLTEYLERVRVYRQALTRATETEAAIKGMERLGVRSQQKDQEDDEEEGKYDDVEGINGSSFGLPPPKMRETMCAMMTSVINFSETCLSTGLLDLRRWERLNRDNFPRVKLCMKAAVKAQAEACVRQILSWKEMMGPKEWRQLYVIIPTVWSVDAENPRKTMFRQLMDEDRVDSHIITSEYPRDHPEARTLLGRIVGDRSIGRFVFGDGTKEQKIKTMGLSTAVDVVQDDALPAIWSAMESEGCPVRRNRSSVHVL